MMVFSLITDEAQALFLVDLCVRRVLYKVPLAGQEVLFLHLNGHVW